MTDDPTRPRRVSVTAKRGIAWFVVAACIVSAIASVIASLDDNVTTENQAAWVVPLVTYAIVGGFIIHRRPDHTIGWVLLLPALTSFAWFALPADEPPSQVTVGLVAAIQYDNLSWMALIFPIILVLALFPTGRLLSPRWRWQTRTITAMVGFLLFISLFAPEIGPLEGEWTIDNPIGFLPDVEAIMSVVMPFWSLGLAVVTVGSLVSMAMRFRRAGWEERQQLKWLLFAVLVFTAIYIPLAFAGDEVDSTVFDSLLLVAVMFLPIAMGIAILRHKVLDIDVVVRRTASYAVVTALLAAVYVGSVVLIRSAVDRITGSESDLAVAGSTLVVAALFNPVRTRVQRGVGRRFFRGPYDPEQILSGFSSAARDQTDIDLLSGQLTGAVTGALQPALVGLLLTPGPAE